MAATPASESTVPELLNGGGAHPHNMEALRKTDSHATAVVPDTPAHAYQHDAEAAHGARSRPDVALTDQTNLLPFRRVLAVFGGLSLCALVSCLDSTIVATALPSISAAFNAGSVSSWVPSAYLLTSTAFQPLCECACGCSVR